MMLLFKHEMKIPSTLCNKKETLWSFCSCFFFCLFVFFHFTKKILTFTRKRPAFNVTSWKDNCYILILKTPSPYPFCFLTLNPITYHKIMYDENEINWIYSFKTHLQILQNHIKNIILHNLMTQMGWTKSNVSGIYLFIFFFFFFW